MNNHILRLSRISMSILVKYESWSCRLQHWWWATFGQHRAKENRRYHLGVTWPVMIGEILIGYRKSGEKTAGHQAGLERMFLFLDKWVSCETTIHYSLFTNFFCSKSIFDRIHSSNFSFFGWGPKFSIGRGGVKICILCSSEPLEDLIHLGKLQFFHFAR